jgi:hypothetical protein
MSAHHRLVGWGSRCRSVVGGRPNIRAARRRWPVRPPVGHPTIGSGRRQGCASSSGLGLDRAATGAGCLDVGGALEQLEDGCSDIHVKIY